MNEYAKYQFYFNIFQFVLTCAVGFGAWWRTREKADDAKVQAAETNMQKRLESAKSERDKRCEEHKQQTAKDTAKLQRLYEHLHEEISHLPGRQELQDLTASMRNLTDRIGNLDGRMQGVNRAVDLINQFLIEQGGKK